ncbi:MAG TPA: DNA-3-methyladenine glycosylase [Desulfurella acetivorans]|uniref:Putative 3-methyladenine DNA glycosylase n=1 Tax=Desulfurella acetivorans TaxID=33002 RepID=A0A7C6A710_DESAE|nr:DNA-3-methyladenine glycosylase [Desulfurella acetivorans]
MKFEMFKLEEIKNLDFKNTKVLDGSFFARSSLLLVCRELLGKILLTNTKEGLSGGMISEVEAYFGSIDLASHAYKNKRTKRNEALYQVGGRLYVHTCRGHVMLNIVTNTENIPQGILIRGIVPLIGIDLMRKRRGFAKDKDLANGPGKLTKALGITMQYNMLEVCKDKSDFLAKLPAIIIIDAGIKIDQNNIKKTPRIGINYAKAWAKEPLRFLVTYSNTLTQQKLNNF